MGELTDNLGLYLTDMDADGEDAFDFERDLNGNLRILDAAIASLGGNGVPPSFCKNLKIAKSSVTTFYAWKDSENNIVYTESATPAASNPVYSKSDVSIIKTAYTVTSYNSGTSQVIVNSVTYTRDSTDDESVIKSSLNWKDPQDTIVDDQLICTWAGSKIIRKEGSYPSTPADGVEVLDNTSRDIYASTPLIDIVADTSNTYYYKAFPYSVNDVICMDKRNNFGSAIIYEFTINDGNSNPSGAVKYIGETESFTPAAMNYTRGEFDYGSWEDAFFMNMFKPCMLKSNGEVDYYLNKNDFSKKEDGVTASDIANTAYDGNAMVEIDQIWIKEYNENGLKHVCIANQKVDNDYDCFTHYNENNQLQEHYYMPLYLGSLVGTKIRSLSGQSPNRTTAGDTQRTYCRNNGSGWRNDEYSGRRLINYLLILMSKTLDFQTAFGTGRYTGGTEAYVLNSGQNNARGMFYGDNNNGAVTVFYIENWWGNLWRITDGLMSLSNKLWYKLTPGTIDGSSATDYNATGTGYRDSGITVPAYTEAYISKTTLVPKMGLVPTLCVGSSTTNYCDGFWNSSSVVGFARFGSNPTHGLLVGAFALIVHVAVSNSAWDSGVALSFKKSS